ncbi:MAG TPA: hypothetical protein ENH57_01280 [Actinobacteria bacterium]|nr:hypothetical protein [Actinomycetota bacterium]
MDKLMKEDFKIFKEATDILDKMDLDYVVFGGIAVWAYGRKRQTKDIDLLIEARSANKALLALLKAGWSTTMTDKNWLFQARKNGVQVDLIFQAKGNYVLTKEIIDRAVPMEISGYKFKVISPEDLVLVKIYALKEIRPADWYDATSVIMSVKGKLDWDYIVDKANTNPRRVLSFLLFAQTEIPARYVPDWVLDKIMHKILPRAA